MWVSLLVKKISLYNRETTIETYNQSIFRAVSPVPMDTSTKHFHPHLRLRKHCGREGGKTVGAMGSGSLL